MSDDDSHSRKVGAPVQTDVTIYLGDGSGPSLHIVCEGRSILFDEPRWERALRALNRPSPRGPYPVAQVCSVSVHEIRLGLIKTLTTLHVAVECRDSLAHVRMHSTLPLQTLEVPFVVGDDVVTIARSIFEAAAK
jgi:hypothetical protein